MVNFHKVAWQLVSLKYTFFYMQLNFQSEPGVANEILENEPKSCLAAAFFTVDFYMF